MAQLTRAFPTEAEEPCGSPQPGVFHDSRSSLLFPPPERPAGLSSPQDRGEHVHTFLPTWYLRILCAKKVGMLQFLGLERHLSPSIPRKGDLSLSGGSGPAAPRGSAGCSCLPSLQFHFHSFVFLFFSTLFFSPRQFISIFPFLACLSPPAFLLEPRSISLWAAK